MPLAFAGSAGGLLLLTGSPVNVVISEAAADAGVGAFGFAEFALVGVPLVVGTIAIVAAARGSAAARPAQRPAAAGPQRASPGPSCATTRSTTGLPPAGPAGLRPRRRSPESRDLADYPDVRLITVLDGATGQPDRHEGLLAAGDRLTLVGDPTSSTGSPSDHGLRGRGRCAAAEDVEQTLLTRDSGAAEVVIPPRSPLAGSEVAARARWSTAASSSWPSPARGEDLGTGPVAPAAPATPCSSRVRGPPSTRPRARHDLLVVDSPELVRRQAVRSGRGRTAAIARARRDGRPAGHRASSRPSWPPCSPRRRWSLLRVRDRAAGLPRDLLDHGAAGRRHDPDVDGDRRRPAPAIRWRPCIVDAVGDAGPAGAARRRCS